MHHKFIYGVPAKEIKKKYGYVIIKSPFATYKAPDRDAKDIGKFIGIEYGRINNLFNEFTYTYDTTFTVSQNCILPQCIIDLFKETYPDVEGNSYALIQNVYCAKFVNGYVATGYWIFCEEETKDKLIEAYSEGIMKLDVLEVGHNMAKNTPSNLFIGSIIEKINDCEDCDPWCFNDLAKTLHKTYTAGDIPDRGSILNMLHEFDKFIVISHIPMTCVIESMCYCCT